MRKSRIFLVLTVFLMVLSLTAVGFAGQSSLGCDNKDAKPTVAVIVTNNAKTTFDGDLTQKVSDGIMAKLSGRFTVVPSSAFAYKFTKAGILDLATAEKEDIAKVLRADGIRYVVYAEIEPFVRKERVGLLHYGLDMTAVMPFRITDLCKNQNLFIGKFVELASDSTAIGFGIKNRTMALEALDKVMVKVGDALIARLP